MLGWIDHPDYGRLVVPNNPIIFHGADRARAVPSAELGQHTSEVLSSVLGMSQAEIAELEGPSVIDCAAAA